MNRVKQILLEASDKIHDLEMSLYENDGEELTEEEDSLWQSLTEIIEGF